MADFKLNEGERLITERRTVTFRKEEFEYIHTCIMDENGEMWTTTELDEVNINQVYNQYRVKNGIPFPSEIIALRKHYDLSAAKMSEILGFGANQYRLYEDGEVPSVSNSRTLVAIRDKNTFISLIDAAAGILGEKEHNRIRQNVLEKEDFVPPVSTPSSFSGYTPFSISKISAAVLFFIKEMSGVFVTKMNKLMFYADFLSYRRRGYGITGLEYKALQFGPVPEKWGAVYNSIPGVEMEEYIYKDSMSGIELTSAAKPDMNVFDSCEKEVLREVADKFKNSTACLISEVSHHEKGWLENHENSGFIDYSYAFDLSGV